MSAVPLCQCNLQLVWNRRFNQRISSSCGWHLRVRRTLDRFVSSSEGRACILIGFCAIWVQAKFSIRMLQTLGIHRCM